MLKVVHTLDVRSFHAPELALPGVERGAADTVLTTYVLGSPARFARLQDCDDLVFSKLKDWRSIATRYDRCDHTFFSAICLAVCVIFYLH